MSFFTDHQVGDTPPAVAVLAGSATTQRRWPKLHPRSSDGGGNETAATHGPIYYAALAPAYLAASSSPFSQLTLMRLTSALIGALTVLFTFLLARELAPGRPWLAVLAALLVAYRADVRVHLGRGQQRRRRQRRRGCARAAADTDAAPRRDASVGPAHRARC